MTKETIRLIEEARKLSDYEWEEFKQKLLKEVEISTIENKICNLFKEIGISVKMRGYHYLKRAITLYIGNTEILPSRVTGLLYPKIAKEFSTSWTSVEKSMRYAIETACSKGDTSKIYEVFGGTYSLRKGKIENFVFITGVAEYILNGKS